MGRHRITAYLLLTITGVCSPAYAGHVVVIVNNNNHEAINQQLVLKIYSGEYKRWKNGEEIVVFALPESNAETNDFCVNVMEKSLSRMEMAWSQMMFSGQALPPTPIATDEEMKKAVSRNVNSIGYINASSLDDTVKVVIK
jgi:ABC-type phosphate transport system substrate-binding protein